MVYRLLANYPDFPDSCPDSWPVEKMLVLMARTEGFQASGKMERAVDAFKRMLNFL